MTDPHGYPLAYHSQEGYVGLEPTNTPNLTKITVAPSNFVNVPRNRVTQSSRTNCQETLPVRARRRPCCMQGSVLQKDFKRSKIIHKSHVSHTTRESPVSPIKVVSSQLVVERERRRYHRTAPRRLALSLKRTRATSLPPEVGASSRSRGGNRRRIGSMSIMRSEDRVQDATKKSNKKHHVLNEKPPGEQIDRKEAMNRTRTGGVRSMKECR